MLALSGCWALARDARAQEPNALISASFTPDALGARTSLAFGLALGSGEATVPPPLRSMTVHLPAGLAIDLPGVATCSPARLRSGGPAACPPGSLLGRGHSRLQVHAGSQSIPEDATITAVRTPDRGGRRTFAIFGHGDTPLQEQTLSAATLLPDRAPYVAKLAISIPPIPTLVLEPDASIVSLSFTLGGSRTHTAGSVTVPRRCPAAGFPFAADFDFADGSHASAKAHARCPARR
jgi:hypothetical protein